MSLGCSECELALDVYEQLQAEGCTPNMVTYNILIDIHSKAGNCEQAVAVLDEIRGQVGWIGRQGARVRRGWGLD